VVGPCLLPLLVTTICACDGAFGMATAPTLDETPIVTYHSTVSEVRLVFFATDEHNHPIDTVQRDDFAVVDNENVIRAYRRFTRSNLTKLDVVMLVDASESVLPHLQREIADVQQMISQWPWGPGDKVSVLSFSGTELRFACTGDCHTSVAIGKLASVPRGGQHHCLRQWKWRPPSSCNADSPMYGR
jgi:hypothetical protein